MKLLLLNCRVGSNNQESAFERARGASSLGMLGRSPMEKSSGKKTNQFSQSWSQSGCIRRQPLIDYPSTAQLPTLSLAFQSYSVHSTDMSTAAPSRVEPTSAALSRGNKRKKRLPAAVCWRWRWCWCTLQEPGRNITVRPRRSSLAPANTTNTFPATAHDAPHSQPASHGS